MEYKVCFCRLFLGYKVCFREINFTYTTNKFSNIFLSVPSEAVVASSIIERAAEAVLSLPQQEDIVTRLILTLP